jgi:hypothetical protein
MIELDSYPLWSILLGSLAAFFGASEIGRQFGVRSSSRGRQNVSTLEGAILGLLALMIGFTFAMALARFETRRDAVLDEANAIGTTALRARLLPAPHDAEVLRLLKEYVEIRLGVARRSVVPGDLDAVVARSGALHEALWRQAQAVAAKDPGMVPTGLFIQSLNELIDQHEKRLTAWRGRVPDIVFLTLYAVAAVSAGFAGYASGLERGSSRAPVYLTGALIAGVVLLILDLDRPMAGFILTSQDPMVDAFDAISGWID